MKPFLETQKTKLLVYLLPILWVFTLILLIPDFGKKTTTIIIISIVLAILIERKKLFHNIVENTKKSTFLISLLVCFIYISCVNCIEGISANYIRVYAGLFLFFAMIPISQLQKIKSYLPIFIILGSFICFLFVLFNTFYLNLGRGWIINPIPYSTVIASFLLSSLYFTFIKKNITLRFFLILSVIINTYGLILGQTRGIWIGTFVGVLIILIQNRKAILSSKKYFYTFLLSSIITISFTYPQISQRLSDSKSEITHIENGNTNTSFGLRLIIWDTAFKIIPDHFLFGVGDKQNEKEIRSIAIEKYKLNPVANTLVHYHNEYINLLVVYGIVGFIIFMIPFILPFVIALKVKPNELSLIVSLFCLYLIAGLTDVPMRNYQSLYIYYFIMAIIVIPLELTKIKK